MDGNVLNTVWLITSAALVFFMQAGFAMVEGGLVRAKNTVNVIMKNFMDMSFGALAFWAVGFGLMFGANQTGWFGTSHFAPNHLSEWDFSFLFFQMMFSATAATIVSGALAERIRFWAYIVASVIVTGLIYPVYGSWVWGSLIEGQQGWLKQLGFIDFAGSSVVHAIGGWCALAGVIVLGPRLGRFGFDGKARDLSGHNLPLFALGAFILWVGWFGFNGGSTIQASTSIGLIVLNTHLAGSAGVVGAILTLALKRRPLLMTASLNGGLGGLVAICAGCATITPIFAILTGLIAGLIVTLAGQLLERLRLDDAVGAVAVHGFGGAWGTLAAALFYKGNMFNGKQVLVQLIGIGAGFLWAFPAALLMFKLINKVMKLRAESVAEQRGLDFAEHYEIGYPEFQQEILHGGKVNS